MALSNELAPYHTMMKNKTGVIVLEDGAGSMVSRAWLTEYAEKTIDIQYFIFSMDNIGLIACDYLVRAADRGVKVRILVDDIMVDADIDDVLMLNSHENIEIKIYNPGVNLGKNVFEKVQKFLTDFRSANQRMHNKTFTVDGNIVITGGRNIADEYFYYDHEFNFRDRDVLLIGQATSSVARSFENYWSNSLSVSVSKLSDSSQDYSDPSRFDQLHEYACNPKNFSPEVRKRLLQIPQLFSDLESNGQVHWVDDVQFVSDIPGKNDGTHGLEGGGVSTHTLAELVRNAKRSIVIQTPYLITTEDSRTLFKEAVDRGVNIRILTNSLASTDNLEAFSAFQSTREELLKTGVEIFEFRPDGKRSMNIMNGELHAKTENPPIFGLHAKSMVIDEETIVIGTFNLDPRSTNLNTECITIIRSAQVAKEVLKEMEEEFKPENAWRTTLDSNPDDNVSMMKRAKTWTRKVVPHNIL
jgi:phosphatidylserine/phosphatidylglycerophosphate/cardiolipin synthase-like enzyme